MKPFKIGDRAIALETKSHPEQSMKKGKVYIVEDIMYCSGCGVQNINIGCKLRTQRAMLTCGSCRNKQIVNGLYYTMYTRFAHPEEASKTLIEEFIKEKEEIK